MTLATVRFPWIYATLAKKELIETLTGFLTGYAGILTKTNKVTHTLCLLIRYPYFHKIT